MSAWDSIPGCRRGPGVDAADHRGGAGLAGCARLCRGPRFETGAWATVLTVNGFIFLMGLLNPDAAANLAPGFAVSVVLATITLDARRTIAQFVVAAVLGLILLLVTDVPPGNFGAAVGITGTIMALTVVVAVRREGDLRQVLRLQRMEHAEAERIRGELDLARKVQVATLPEVVPHVDGVEIAPFSQPAYEASGDFYDLFTLTDQRPGVSRWPSWWLTWRARAPPRHW